MKQVKIFSGLISNVEHDVNDFLWRHDGEVVDIKIVPAQYDQWTKVMVIYDEAEDNSGGGAGTC